MQDPKHHNKLSAVLAEAMVSLFPFPLRRRNYGPSLVGIANRTLSNRPRPEPAHAKERGRKCPRRQPKATASAHGHRTSSRYRQSDKQAARGFPARLRGRKKVAAFLTPPHGHATARRHSSHASSICLCLSLYISSGLHKVNKVTNH